MPLHAKKRPINTTTPKARTATALWWLCWLLLALAPTLGQMHRALHGGHGVAAPLVASATFPAQSSAVEEDNTADIARLFGQHNAQDCQLLDQWTWAHPPSITLAVPRLVPAPPVAVSAYRHAALQTTIVFQARAPPVPSQT